MQLIATELEGVYIIENYYAEDVRGSFTKVFHEDFFNQNDLCTDFKESYFSISYKDVIRGMHFQLPPYDHEKLVYVAQGEVMDVILDLRTDSLTFGKSIQITLSAQNHRSVYIPKGLAHGFVTKVDQTIMVYQVTTVYNPIADSGIHYDSFGIDWGVENPIVSERDQSFETFSMFQTKNPF